MNDDHASGVLVLLKVSGPVAWELLNLNKLLRYALTWALAEA